MTRPSPRIVVWTTLVAASMVAMMAAAPSRNGAEPFRETGQNAPAPQSAPAATRWYKGNTHTHTLNSDGDSTADEVVTWYREHGYQFLVLTDHNFVTSVTGLNALHGADERFLVIPGEEVSARAGDKPVHVNGLDVARRVEPQNGTIVADVIQRNVDAVRQASGVPHINHPNFQWALTADDLEQVKNGRLLELYNGHPQVNQDGGGGIPGVEEVWDRILSSGSVMYGIAVDDAHTFKQPGDPRVAGPGRGWVMVRSPRLDARALLDALERGDFYASTGVVLDEVQISRSGMRIKVRAEGASKYRIQFVGKGGRLLTEVADATAAYTFTGNEGYVRAKVIESNGRLAWVQPVVVPAVSTTARLLDWLTSIL
jgi:hypothetical protein